MINNRLCWTILYLLLTKEKYFEKHKFINVQSWRSFAIIKLSGILSFFGSLGVRRLLQLFLFRNDREVNLSVNFVDQLSPN